MNKYLMTVYTIALGLLVLTTSGCASFENRCLDEANAQPGISDEMKTNYFNSCVQTHRNRAAAWQNAFKSHPKNNLNCTSTNYGGYTSTDCQEN